MGGLRRLPRGGVPRADEDADRRTPGGTPGLRVRTRRRPHDTTDLGERAVPLHREAFDAGLDGDRRRQAVVQLASTLRALGRPQAGADLLLAERDRASVHLDDAVTALLALAFVDLGRAREAAALALGALAPRLPGCTIPLDRYAADLTAPDPTG
ncbi:tetratricopeptide repeat protein [Streptomyces poriticola]|uniref:tetratricopeptide repeat protein n=1 Tax=Streptomyces poriticola TaxID=3120506 RepID=UPI002FCE6734